MASAIARTDIRAVVDISPGPIAEITAPRTNKTMGISFTFPLQRRIAFLASSSSVRLFCAMQNRNIMPRSIMKSELLK